METITKHVKALKSNKAADVFGLTAEHMKYAAPQLITVLTTIANASLYHGKLPAQFKIGAIAPTVKKNKPVRDPDSHRRITVASAVGKVVEKEMSTRTKPQSKIHQDPGQYGFTEECSPSICALMVTEAIADAKDNDTPLYISFMDSSKAFDMVDHTVLLNALHDLQLEPHLWRLYKDMYSAVLSRVRVNGELSRVIKEGRGIRQGGETSTDGFKAKENPFLRKVRTHPDSLRIGTIPMGIPTVADDNCMMATSHMAAQTQLLIAQDNASRVRYVFSETKSKVMFIPDKASKNIPHKPPLIFNGTTISYSDSEKHLGLARTADGKATKAVKESVQTGRRASYKLMGAGLSGVNGISPYYSRHMVTTFVMPAMLYGLEALVLEESDCSKLDTYQRGLLRQIQGLPDSTAKPAIYLLLGSLPSQAMLHQKTLTLFIAILNRPGTPEQQIITRQLLMKDSTSSSWTSKLRLILFKYHLPMALQLTEFPPTKARWKRMVKSAINTHWENKLKDEAGKKKTLRFLNLQACSIGSTHPVWDTGPDPMQVVMATVKATMLVDRYPLTGLKCAGKKGLDRCPHCNLDSETLCHFLLHCPMYTDLRTSYLIRLQQAIPHVNLQATTDDELTTIILDPSHVACDEEKGKYLEGLTRRLCFALHNRRAEEDGRGSRYQWASRRFRALGNKRSSMQIKIPKITCKNIYNVPTDSNPAAGFSC